MLINADSVFIPLASQSVHMVVTSPPYWGLRDYDLPPTLWPTVAYAPLPGMPEIVIPGCRPGCEHVWGDEQPPHHPGQVEQSLCPSASAAGKGQTAGSGQFCELCGGWRGCLGLEPTIPMYVGHIVAIMREVGRVLRDDGTLWLNLGDSYITHPSNGRGGEGVGGGAPHRSGINKISAALKPKDLAGVPWRVALALEADGWYLRSDIIWAKGISYLDGYAGSTMPESVKDRPTKAHEYLFLLSKSNRYYYDIQAIKEQSVSAKATSARYEYDFFNGKKNLSGGYSPSGEKHTPGKKVWDGKRNVRTVWAINPKPYAGSHYATFPPALVAPAIKAGTSAKGVCPVCGAPWERVVEKQVANVTNQRPSNKTGNEGDRNDVGRIYEETISQTTGWQPTCDCHGHADAPDPIPATVLDPFCGSGTTGEVCRTLPHPRKFVTLDLSMYYLLDHALPRAEGRRSERAVQRQLEEMPLFSWWLV